jgi:hypothetical protein
MSNTTFGPGTKKETVYRGPGPQPRLGAFNGPTPKPEGSSVYRGPAPRTNKGTVHSVPTSGGTVFNTGTGGTIYNPARLNPVGRSVKPVTNTSGPMAGALFFLIAGFTAVNAVLGLAGAPFAIALGLGVTRASMTMPEMAALNAVAIGLFVALGVFTIKGNKAACLTGLLLYGADTAFLLFPGDAALHLFSLVVHGMFLFSIFKAFRQLEN